MSVLGGFQRSAVVLLLVLGLAIAGCDAGDDDEVAEEPDADPVDQPDEPADEDDDPADVDDDEPDDADEPPPDDDELTALRAAIVPGATPLPAIVAKGAGIFEDHGLDVELEFVPNLAALPGAMGRQYDFGLTTAPDIINANLQDIDVVLVSGSAYDDLPTETAGVVVSADSPVEEPADLEGMTVGAVTLGGNIHPATVFWLLENDVDVNSMTFVEVPSVNQFDQLQAGSIDAVQSIEPFKGRMKGEGGQVLVDPMDVVMEAHGLETISFLDFMAERAWAEDNPDILERWIASLQEAIEFIDQNETEARQIFSEISDLPPEVTDTVELPNYGTAVSPPEVEAWAEVMKAIGELDEGYEVDIDTLVVTPDENLRDSR